MSLFFQQEFATSIEIDDGYVLIRQYEDNEQYCIIGSIRLTRHQFMELVNHEKYIGEMLNKWGEE